MSCSQEVRFVVSLLLAISTSPSSKLTRLLLCVSFRSSPADNGTVTMWDYATGKPFQHIVDVPQPGSLDAESGIFWCVSRLSPSLFLRRRAFADFLLLVCVTHSSTFDKTGTRLITGGADKTIKVRSLSFPCFLLFRFSSILKRVADLLSSFSNTQIYSEQG